MTAIYIKVLTVLLLTSCLFVASGGAQSPDIGNQVALIDEWMTNRGLTKAFEKQFVRVRSNWAQCAEDGSTKYHYIYGFLTSNHDLDKLSETKTAKLRTLAFDDHSFIKEPAGDDPKRMPGSKIESFDLAIHAQELLHLKWDSRFPTYYDEVSASAYASAVAVALFRSNQKLLADQVILKANQYIIDNHRDESPPPTLLNYLSEEIALHRFIALKNPHTSPTSANGGGGASGLLSRRSSPANTEGVESAAPQLINTDGRGGSATRLSAS
ncbi:MAG: hypothetical protein AAF226_14695, partial [Verrucomicrobiota bacterium]